VNLVGNAVKFTSNGGSVKVRANFIHEDSSHPLAESTDSLLNQPYEEDFNQMNSREYEERFFETKEVYNIEKGSLYKQDS
jgi:hypothetical protein